MQASNLIELTYLDVVNLVGVLVIARLLAVEGSMKNDDEPVVGHHKHKLVWLRVVYVGLGDVDVHGQLLKPLPELEAAGTLSPSPSRPVHSVYVLYLSNLKGIVLPDSESMVVVANTALSVEYS